MNSRVLFEHLPLPARGQLRSWWAPLNGSALALAASELPGRSGTRVVVVTRDTHAAQMLESDLRVFSADASRVLHLPDWETLPYDRFSPHSEIVSQRISTLAGLHKASDAVLVVPVSTLMQRLAPRSFISGRSLQWKLGQRMDLEAESLRLQAAGYRHVPQVLEPGDFAQRGGILDLFPMGSELPFRVELFDDEIESLRSFDPETQRSLDKVERIDLLPAREFPLDEEATRSFRNRFRELFTVDLRRCTLYQDMKAGTTPAGIEYYLPLFFEHTETLFDYLAGNTLFLLAEGVFEAAEHVWTQASERYEQRCHDVERPILPPQDLMLPPERLRERLNLAPRIEIVAPASEARAVDARTQPAPSLPLHRKGEEAGESLSRFLASYPGRVLLTTDSAGRREALLEQLAAMQLRPDVVSGWSQFAAGGSRFALAVATLEDGLALTEPALVVLTENQLYGERAQQQRRRRRSTRDPDAIIRDLGELSIGSPVVHEDHGVGRYHGLVTLDVGGMPGEFLQLEYAKGDKLYVPVSALHLVSRYSGANPDLAPLHSLGGEQWEKAKRKAAERVRDVAAELLEIYARREARQGTALKFDRELYEQFAAQFPFEETDDQLNAIEAVLSDLAARKPMDRVVCGDVGFGKTEVALRAAFATAISGKQVALLVPTTLLAQQHFQNFSDRLADWPIRVDVLSRFKTAKEVKEALGKVERGEIDILVGTHRLLQPDVRFKDLGLVIVDEEQRFGVRQKERFKQLRAEVDLLTLTATPIPRTLNMAMSGLRDLSIIATPPAHRMAVKTFVSQWDPALLREAFQRELARGGQVYFLHNEVESIEKTARELGELVPDARLRVAHGQMPEKELEQVMLDFYRQRFNVLVCTTIIESGIDVPSANTIIINRADRLGLAQLHQLRGRVGRSHHRAYAYLVVPHPKAMTADAEKRLEALASLEDLGAGFTLATHDLEIRGAGELLGEEQSGQIQEVGFSLYTELLERAVRSLKAGKIPDLDPQLAHGTEVNLYLPALIPDDYLPDVHTRLTLYKRISAAADEHALRELQVEMIDRFGLLPEQVKSLFAVTSLKLRASRLGMRKLEVGPMGGRIIFEPSPKIEPMTVIRLIQSQPRVFALDGQDKLKWKLECPEPADRLAHASELLDKLGARRAA